MRAFAAACCVLLTALAAVAVAPGAEAKPVPPGPCAEKQFVGNHDTGVYMTMGCQLVVSADPMDCLWGEEWVTYTVGGVTVRYTRCTSPPGGEPL